MFYYQYCNARLSSMRVQNGSQTILYGRSNRQFHHKCNYRTHGRNFLLPQSCLFPHLRSNSTMFAPVRTVEPHPRLENITRLSHRVIRILGQNPGPFTLQGSNTYLVGTQAARILIDTGQGVPAWRILIQQCLEAENAYISLVLITHWHDDHTGGASDVMTLKPRPENIYKHPDVPLRNMQDLQDGQRFTVPGATVRAVYTPGHTSDHTVFVLEEEGAVFTGDNVLGHGTTKYDNLVMYLEALKKMRLLVSGRGYPGHGDVLPNVSAKIELYLEHRETRAIQVLTVLRWESTRTKPIRGISSLDLVRIIYKDVSESLYEAAEEGVIQMLERWEREGLVEYEENGHVWYPTDECLATHGTG